MPERKIYCGTLSYLVRGKNGGRGSRYFLEEDYFLSLSIISNKLFLRIIIWSYPNYNYNYIGVIQVIIWSECFLWLVALTPYRKKNSILNKYITWEINFYVYLMVRLQLCTFPTGLSEHPLSTSQIVLLLPLLPFFLLHLLLSFLLYFLPFLLLLFLFESINKNSNIRQIFCFKMRFYITRQFT